MIRSSSKIAGISIRTGRQGQNANSGLGVNHPDVKAAQAEIDTIEGQLRKQTDSIRKGLATQLAIAEDSESRRVKSDEQSNRAADEKHRVLDT
jgi:uncharacterized protein involved in exopolysaccharide biosynthesis